MSCLGRVLGSCLAKKAEQQAVRTWTHTRRRFGGCNGRSGNGYGDDGNGDLMAECEGSYKPFGRNGIAS